MRQPSSESAISERGSTARILRRLVVPAATPELSAQFADAAIQEIVDDTFVGYERQRAALPREASSGGQIMVHLAALTIAFYRSLLKRDLSVEEARSLTARITKRIYNQMATVPTVLSLVGRGGGQARLRRATDLFRGFPFSPPSYEMVDVPADDGVVAFDVRRCPVAEYFRAQQLSEICVESWCNLDFELAERWGGRLERTKTIAAGAGACDFRWHTVTSQDIG